jgi:DNA-binding transcriptional regulator PaaX
MLKQYSYGCLNKNIWISPFNNQEEIIHSEKFIHSVEELKIESKIYFFESRLVDNKDQTNLISDIWPINKLAARYRDFITSFNNELKNYDINAYHGGGGLPFLHRFGLEFFEIVRDDPYLPLVLLPEDWMGVKAAMAFKNIRGEIIPLANEFINRVLQS